VPRDMQMEMAKNGALIKLVGGRDIEWMGYIFK
jgi:hypothetical protein